MIPERISGAEWLERPAVQAIFAALDGKEGRTRAVGGVVRDSGSGRSKSVICDFCYSWRAGGNAGLVTFYADARSHDSTSQLCCLDLLCSLHVRTKTKDALLSRAQLREHMSDDDRIVRLKEHLQSFIDKLNLHPVDIG